MTALSRLQHPSNVATDALLGTFTLVLGIRLLRIPSRPARLFGLAFLCVGIAAFTGGAFHGLEALASPLTLTVLWKTTVQLIGAGSMLLGIAAVMICVRTHRLALGLQSLVILQFILYAVWMLNHDDFRYVIYQYGISMILVLVLFASTWRRHPGVSTPIVAAVLVAVAGALIQQLRLGLHTHFDHNDLYHVVQMATIYLLYRGGGKAVPR